MGYANAASIPVLPMSPTVSRSRPIGPVAGPPRPRVSILRPATVRAGRIVLARVHCSVPCHITLQVIGGREDVLTRSHVTGHGVISVARPPAPDGPAADHALHR